MCRVIKTNWLIQQKSVAVESAGAEYAHLPAPPSQHEYAHLWCPNPTKLKPTYLE